MHYSAHATGVAGRQRAVDDAPDVHPDTIIVDALTARLNSENEPSGADIISLLTRLIDDSGRPLIEDVPPIAAAVEQDRYGIAFAMVTTAGHRIVISQHNGLVIEVTSNDEPDEHPASGLTLDIVVDGLSLPSMVLRAGREPARQSQQDSVVAAAEDGRR